MCLGGATNAELADEFGVSIRTIDEWKAKYPEFLRAIKASKPVADQRVERSLYERAVGYTVDTEKVFCGKDGQVTRVAVREYYPPDTTAMIFWLKNRKQKEWRDKIEHTGAGDGPIELIVRRVGGSGQR